MNFTPLEVAERHRFAEQSIERSSEIYSRPEIAQYSTRAAAILPALTEKAFVPNIDSSGGIIIPKQYHLTDTFPVVAMHPGEIMHMGEGFKWQTPFQMDKLTDTLTTWCDGNENSVDHLEVLFANTEVVEEEVAMSPYTGAWTGGLQIIFDRATVPELAKAPKGRIGQFLLRPLVCVNMDASVGGTTDPIVLSHEEAHVAQQMREPILLYDSRESFVMKALENELEAYHVSAVVRMAVEGLDILTADLVNPNQDVIDLRYLSLLVEAIRVEINGKNDEGPDRFRPSPKLLKLLNSHGAQFIIHAHLDFDFDALIREWDKEYKQRRTMGRVWNRRKRANIS